MYISGYAAQRAVAPGAGQRAYISGPGLESLEPGDTVTAKVVSENGETLTFKTPDGTRFTARNDGPPLPVGQTVTLTVRARSDAGTAVEISAVGELDVKALLDSFGASATRETVLLAREMAAQRMPLTTQSFQAVSQLLQAEKALSAEQAVFMAHNKIPVDTQSIAQFKGFLEHRGRLGDALNRILGALEGEDGAGPEAMRSPEPGAQEHAAVPRLSTDGALPAGPERAGPDGIRAQQQMPPQAAQAPDGADPARAPDPQTAPPEAGEAAPTPSGAGAKAPGSPDLPARTGLPGSPEGSAPAQGPAPADAGKAGEASASRAARAGSIPAQTGEAAHADRTPAEKPASLPAADSPAPEGVRETSVSRENAQASPRVPPGAQPERRPGGAAPEDLALKKDAPAQSEAPARTRPDPDPVQNPARAAPRAGGELRELAEKLFKTVEPGRKAALAEELGAPALKRELGRFLAAVEARAPALPESARDGVARAARELETSFRFLEQINNFTAYAQLPLSVNGERTTAELYVFNDSRERRTIDPGNATLFFSLGTANAGRVEVFARVTGRNVECDFGLEDEDAAAAFRGHMPALGALLDAEGYRLARAGASVRDRESDAADIARRRPEAFSRYRLNRSV